MYVQRVYMCRDGGPRAVMSPVNRSHRQVIDRSEGLDHSPTGLETFGAVPSLTISSSIDFDNSRQDTLPCLPCLIGRVNGDEESAETKKVGSATPSLRVPVRQFPKHQDQTTIEEVRSVEQCRCHVPGRPPRRNRSLRRLQHCLQLRSKRGAIQFMRARRK